MTELLAAVNQRYSDYCFAIDRSELDDFERCFAEDAVFEIVGQRRFSGRDEIRGMVANSSSDRPRHHYLNLGLVSSSDELVRSRAYFLLVNPTSGAIDSYGEYDDDLTPDGNGGFVFAHRRVNFLWLSDSYRERLAGVSGR